MATRTINPQSNPYGGGAVVFDSTPYVDYYLKEQQKEDAKNEALDRYYQEEMSKVSPAGMRSEDLPVFNQKFNELKSLWVKDKEAIKNPSKYGFDKAQQYNQLKADLMSLPIESKEEKEKEATVLRLLADPAKRELVDIPTLSEAMSMQKMPIRTEGRKSVDLANLPFLAKEMTPQEKATYVKSVLGLAGKDVDFGKPTKLGGYQEKVTYTTQYSDENLKKLGDIARKDALTNKNLARTAKLDFERITPEMKLELDALHKQLYGRPIQGAEDLAAASIIQSGRLAKEEESKSQRDEAAIQAAKNARAAAKEAEKEKKKNATTDFVLRMKNAAEEGTVQDMANIGMELLAGGGAGTNKEFVQIKVGNDKKGFKILYKDRYQGRSMDNVKEETFNLEKPESYLKLARLFQDITGSSAALEKSIFTGKGDYLSGGQPQQAGTKPSTTNQQPAMITVVLNGKEGQIPSDKIGAFLKKYPTAKRK